MAVAKLCQWSCRWHEEVYILYEEVYILYEEANSLYDEASDRGPVQYQWEL